MSMVPATAVMGSVAVMVAVPGLTAVTRPVVSTVASVVSEELQIMDEVMTAVVASP